ncbi:MAG: hypothetical protein WA970_11775 [Gammaproteobacteria bacterium]
MMRMQLFLPPCRTGWQSLFRYSPHMTTKHSDELRDALDRLLDSAYADTGGSRRAAEFLLSLWNGARFTANLQELLYVDTAQFTDMQTVLQELYRSKAQLDTFVTEDQMKPIIEDWGKTFASVRP